MALTNPMLHFVLGGPARSACPGAPVSNLQSCVTLMAWLLQPYVRATLSEVDRSCA